MLFFFVVIFLAQISMLGSTVLLLNARFVHTGRVCSGEYLHFNEADDGYLVEQGIALKGLAFAICAKLIFVVCILCSESKKKLDFSSTQD